MAWQDRIKNGAITGPSGTRIQFDYENLSSGFDKNASAFEFQQGTYVQNIGNSGRRFPLRMFFWGDDCDLLADELYRVLSETGVWLLEFPIGGTYDVVPYGPIKRMDNLTTAANQVVFEVEFWETIGVLYPQSQRDPSSEVIASVDEYNAATSEKFSEDVDVETTLEQVTAKNKYQAVLDATSQGLGVVADTQDDVKQQFNQIVDSVNQSIDVLIEDPTLLALQTVLLIQSPARAVTNINTRLSVYSNLIAEVIAPGLYADPNEFFIADLYASTYLTAQVIAVVNNTFYENQGVISGDVITRHATRGYRMERR